METTVYYNEEEVTAAVGLVSEARDHAEQFLESAIDVFNRRMAIVDSRAERSGLNDDELLIVTTKAVMDLEYACNVYAKTCVGDSKAIRAAQKKVQKGTEAIFAKSYYTHARTWPKGYQGDHEIIEFHYRGVPLSQGAGYYLDRYLLVSTLAVAVRERKETLRRLLQAEMSATNNLRILDLGCGSCREVFELIPEIQASKARLTCIDFDADALSYSANRMQHAGLSDDVIDFRRYNALKMVSHERNLAEFGMQDVIYSVGLFDYLSDEVLVRLLRSLYQLVTPGGRLIASFKDSRRYSTFIYHWLINWNGFLQRTGTDIWNIYDQAGIPRDKVTTEWEKSGVINFYIAKK